MNISFIIPVYNGGKTLDRTLGSIFLADSDLYEVILVNDGSSDATPEICQKWKKKYPQQIVYASHENRGVAVTRNRGIKLSSGEWLWFVDCGDELAEDAVVQFQETINECNEPNIVMGAYRVYQGQTHHTTFVGSLSEDKGERIIDFLMHKKLRPTHGAIVVNRRLVDKMKYCSEMRQSEDIPVFVSLLLEEGAVVTERCFLYAHRGVDSLRTNADYVSRQIDLLVDQVFAVPNLPEFIKPLRAKYAATRCISACRISWRAGRKDLAKKCFWKSVKTYPASLFWPKSLRFLFRAYRPGGSKVST